MVATRGSSSAGALLLRGGGALPLLGIGNPRGLGGGAAQLLLGGGDLRGLNGGAALLLLGGDGCLAAPGGDVDSRHLAVRSNRAVLLCPVALR
ncbi:hypothetical protein E2562_020050 [Oryza meyeriana var. granulata]|uniref:Uncharacterized protein n=1 Tax=Oryza meyeriana var. granulata TaxID=110450 RepID=A0A6G1BYV0_9ORYZ|nr:hypothetical protein E2562_020050 [Oryza meyeriana var. granulata]